MIPQDWELIVANRQRTRRLNTPLLKQFLSWLLRKALAVEHAELGIHLVSAAEMARVHQEYMNIAGSTDVITFDHGSEPPGRIHGELFISVEDAIGQAKEFKTTWQGELARYVIHGVLHLLGHDDLKAAPRAKMKRTEDRLLREAARKFRLSALEKI